VLAIAREMAVRRPHHNKYLIAETSFFHCKEAFRKMERKTAVKALFLPPQTPMLNPTEYFFS
jgi:transposase